MGGNGEEGGMTECVRENGKVGGSGGEGGSGGWGGMTECVRGVGGVGGRGEEGETEGEVAAG